MRRIFMHLRTLIRFSLLIYISIFLIVGLVVLLYKPIYSVYLNGELIGYCRDKNKLQTRINSYMENGPETENETNLAFVSIDNLPTYKMCLLKRNITTNDDEIFNTVVKDGVSYYKYYAILDDDDEKVYVANFETAEKIIDELKDSESNNIDELSIIEKYETKLENFSDQETAVSELYEKKPVVVAKKTTTKYSSSGQKVSTSFNISSSRPSLGLSLIRPVSGSISSRFGSMSRVRSGVHTGLDIAASSGTTIKAAASGTVVFSGYKGSFGNMIAIDHGNGVLTYYGHCSKLYVSAGTKVSQGTAIAAVGSTGNSTGPHLHFEVRVNGVAYNPQNYVY